MAGPTTGTSWSVVAPIRRQSRAGSTFVMRRHPVNATRRGAPSCRPRRFLATGAARGMWASRLRPVERAAASIAAAGAMRSTVHPSCEVSIPGTRSPVQASIPGGHVAAVHQRRRPMSPALGRDQWQPTGDCRGHRRTPHRSRIYIYRSLFYHFTEVVDHLSHMGKCDLYHHHITVRKYHKRA